MVAWVSDSVFPSLNAGEWEGLTQMKGLIQIFVWPHLKKPKSGLSSIGLSDKIWLFIG
jgi:hypothetical protein